MSARFLPYAPVPTDVVPAEAGIHVLEQPAATHRTALTHRFRVKRKKAGIRTSTG
jgi:hypothetical protein